MFLLFWFHFNEIRYVQYFTAIVSYQIIKNVYHFNEIYRHWYRHFEFSISPEEWHIPDTKKGPRNMTVCAALSIKSCYGAKNICEEKMISKISGNV